MEDTLNQVASAAESVAAATTEAVAQGADAVKEVAADAVAAVENVAADVKENAAEAVETVTQETVPEQAESGKCENCGLWIVIGVVVVVAILIMAFGRKKKSGCTCGCGGKSAPDAAPSNGKAVEIYVGNLSYSMTDDQLRKEFERFGVVKSARVIGHRASGKSKGYGFVEMPHRKEAEIAIKNLNNREVMGRKLRVNEAKRGIPKE